MVLCSKEKEGSKVGKWTRHNLIALWDGQPYSCAEERVANMAECDRIYIALHRFQTEDKIAYRRLIGMHGGGGGTKDCKFRKILNTKVEKDIVGHTGFENMYPDNGYWPGPVPNATPSVLVGKENENRCFTYTFCWHAQPEFLLWHRPMVAEFERGLQDNDPKYGPGDENRRGSDAIGAPYWGWEGWDGLSLPQIISNPVYVLKTDTFKKAGYPKGSIFPNPFYRWFAPVCLEDQVGEYFPSTLADHNTTTRSSAFTDNGAEFEFPWEQVSRPKKPSMKDVVVFALTNPNWMEFCTVNKDCGGGAWSIENAHNKFHNHIGGLAKGGIQGSGIPKRPTISGTKDHNEPPEEYTGTMSQNQSSFDPLFFLHHSNVDRQFYSWQKRFAKPENALDVSKPSEKLMNRVLYPWTKPNELFRKGNLSHNTPSSEETDARFSDWWPTSDLPYEYEEYLTFPAKPDIPFPPKDKNANAIRMKVYVAKRLYKGGEYDLFYTSKSTPNEKVLVGALSILSGVGGTCAQCTAGNEAAIAYEVSDTFHSVDDVLRAFKNGEFCLTRNEIPMEINKVEAMLWNN